MKYSYINLASATDRRCFVEDNFQTNSHEEKNIVRREAFDVDYVLSQSILGGISAAEKACYLSHIETLQDAKVFSDDVFIAEDDVLFCEHSTRVIEATLARLAPRDWDLVFTDVCIPNIHTMIDLFLARRKFDETKQIQVLNLAEMPFAGATAYVVNSQSIDKLLSLLPGPPCNSPYDLALRQLVYDKKINAFVIFPFATSLSHYAENTQIQAADTHVTDVLLNAFRRLVWLGRDLDTAMENISRITDDFYARDSDAFSRITRALLSSNYDHK